MVTTVLGLGTATMDVVLQCDYLPKADEFEIIKNQQVMSGGSCGNMLVTLAKLGVHAKQLAKIGDDSFGLIYRADMVEAGVDDSLLLEVRNGRTMHTYIMAAGNGEHCIFANMGDCILHLQPEEITSEMLAGVDLFYTDMFPGPAALAAAKLCKIKHIPIIFCLQCPAVIMEKIGVDDAQLMEMIGLADLIVAGRGAYESLFDKVDYRQVMEKLLAENQLLLGAVCTAGESGAFWLTKEQTYYAKAYQVEAVDTTGAGDCFLGGLIYSYFDQGKQRQTALDFAAATAAIKCTQFGPRIKTTRAEVQRLLDSKE